MSTQTVPNIAGGWLGTYYYQGAQRINHPVRFEASFAGVRGGPFSGTWRAEEEPEAVADTETSKHVAREAVLA